MITHKTEATKYQPKEYCTGTSLFFSIIVNQLNVSTLAAPQLIKTYNKRNVVDGVSLHVNTEEVVGLLGPKWGWKNNQFLHDGWPG